MPNQDNNIEQETYVSALHLPKIISVLKSSDKKGCTKAWLIAQTGLSMFQVEDALRELMYKYFCKLLVDEKTGEMLYYFDLQQLVNKLSLLEKIRSYAVFILEFFFKLWICLMLFTFGFFYGAIVALILTGLSQSIQVILFFIVGYFSAVYELLLSIVQYFSGEKNRQRFSEKNLLHLVFIYVFGPTIKNDPYRTEKIILEYLATHQYKITKTELLMLTGWQAQKIEEEIQQLIINYRGEPTVSEEGVIVYNFPEISITQEELLENSDTSNKSYWVWDRKLELQKLSIGEASTVIAIVMLIGSFFSMAYTVYADPTSAQFW